MRWSLRLQVAVFTVLGILVCFSVSFVVALWFPTPEPRRVSVAEAVQALEAPEVLPGWRRSVVDAPPFQTAAQGQDIVIRAGLASELGLSPDQVRVRSLRQSRPPSTSALAAQASAGGVLSERAAQFLVRLALSPGTRFGLFSTAVQQRDGSWLYLQPKTAFVTPERLRMLTALAVAAAVIIPLALWGCSILTAPFRRLEQAAADDARLDSAKWVRGPVEAQGAAKAMDAMRHRLLDHLRSRTAMMAAIAHDLRTPLTGLRLRVEGLTGAPRDEAVADIARMERMIAHLLTYVRGEEVAWTTEPVDLADVLKDCVSRQRLLGHDVSLTATGEHLVLADRDQIDRALSNLIDNAVVHGGRAQIGVVTQDGVVTCTIDDDGPGLTPDQIEAVFTPFHRLDVSRNRNTGGAGLGLAIAKAILARAGGEIELMNRDEGGLHAKVQLPALETEQGGHLPQASFRECA